MLKDLEIVYSLLKCVDFIVPKFTARLCAASVTVSQVAVVRQSYIQPEHCIVVLME